VIDPQKAILLLRLAVDVIAGDRKDGAEVAREMMALAVDLIPVEDLKQFLTDRERKFTDLEADVLEQVKLSAVAAEAKP